MKSLEISFLDKFSCEICNKLCSLRSPKNDQREEIWVCPICYRHFCYLHREEHIKEHKY